MKKITLLTTLSLFLFSGLLFAEVSAPTACIPVYTEDQSNIDATTQHTFIIKLKANATTGYEWFADYDKSLLKVNYTYDSSYDPTQTNQKVGAPGSGIWIVEVKPQPISALAIVKNTEIHFAYKRGWEKDIAPIQQLTFYVTLPTISGASSMNDAR